MSNNLNIKKETVWFRLQTLNLNFKIISDLSLKYQVLGVGQSKLGHIGLAIIAEEHFYKPS